MGWLARDFKQIYDLVQQFLKEIGSFIPSATPNDYYYTSNAPSQRFAGIKTGETLDLGAGEFTLKDGTRFNPLSVKPTSISASCNGTGFGYWTW